MMTIDKRIYHRTTLVILFLITIAFKQPALALTGVSASDSLALVAFYNANNGPNWFEKGNWLQPGKFVEEWYGINTNGDGGRVTGINFEGTGIGNNLSGQLSARIGDLTQLTALRLTHNSNLTGPIPDLRKLINLQDLILTDNNLTGSIPSWIWELVSLQELFLENNDQLGGPIPDALYELSSLKMLKLFGCNFTGSISHNIQNLDKIQILELQNNNLSDSIPSEIGELSSLTKIDISNNQLTGEIPGGIVNLLNLEELRLNNNKLIGTIPLNIGKLENLFYLYLDHNQLSGIIPTSIGQLSSLIELSLSSCSLSGSIPPEIEGLTNLTRLLLQVNNLSGAIPSEIGKLKKLNIISLELNKLDGVIPTEIGSLKDLVVINLRVNNLSGSIPPEICNLHSLNTLYLDENKLTGSIPDEIGNLTELATLTLGKNQLSGIIPAGISNLKKLETLQLQNNYFDEMYDLSNISTQLYCESNLITFEDLELNFALIGKLGSNFDYSPQREFGIKHDTTAFNDRPFTLKIPCGGANNHYQWYKNDTIIPKSDFPELFFPSIQFADTGTYHILVTNPNFPLLTLKSLPVHLKVERPCIEPDSLALVALFHATDGPNWTHHENWLEIGKPLNTWFGIKADSCSVSGINLPNNKLTDTIPAELYNLTNLKTLDLSENKLEGNISTKIGQLANLQALSLRGNSLTGQIPKEIGNLTNLLQLGLSENQLSGTIPPEVGYLNNLLGLNFANNRLSGSIPVEIGNLTNIQFLGLNDNELSNNIPKEIGNLINLKFGLMLGNNRLTGEIPTEIGNLTQLEKFSIDGNLLTDSIPSTIQNLINLKDFQFQDNLIIDIPALPAIDTLIYCYNNYLTFEDFEQNLDLVRNKEAGKVDFQYSPQYKFGKEYFITITEDSPFSLSIPCEGKYNHYKWYKNEKLQVDSLDSNTWFFPSIALTDAGTYFITVTNDSVRNLELTSLPVHLNVKKHCIRNDSLALKALYFATNGPKWTNHTNWLENGKPVRTWFGIEADSCSVLKIDLTNNNLTGSISGIDSITEVSEYFTQLNHLYLDQNHLNGKIPNAVGGFSELEELNLSDNEFDGEIPKNLGNLSNLTTLELGGNLLEGEIPAEIYNLAELKRLVLTTNKLSGEIPAEIGTLLKLEALGLGDNRFDGSIPGEIGNLKKLTDLDLHKNNFSGSIPSSIGNLYNLEILKLSENHLSGIVPSVIGNLSDLTYLAINNNELEGDIPQEIRKLVNLESLRIEYNFLEGLPLLPDIDTLFWSNDNYLTFEDFELNLAIIKNKKTDLEYSPQYKFGREYTITAYEGTPFTLSIPTGGIYNHYTWYKNNFDLKDTTDAYKLYFPAIQLADSGSYHITVTNDSVRNLTLQSKSVRINLFKKPTLNSSNCGLINQQLSDTLTWNKVAWADSYGLQVSTFIDFRNTIIDISGITKTSYILNNLEYGTKYYWRVNASDSIGTTGWSDVCNFTTLPEIPDPPLLESTCDGPEIQELSNSVSWYGSERAVSYTLQVSTSPDFSTIFLNESKISSTSYTISGLDFNTTYYWRVNATNITGSSKWSTVCNFKTYQPELSFINLVIIDGQHSPLFMIEGIKYNHDNNLTVFTKWGKKVYSKTGYNNELDFSSYPSGTYYYVLNVKVNGIPKQYKSFVDVVKQ